MSISNIQGTNYSAYPTSVTGAKEKEAEAKAAQSEVEKSSQAANMDTYVPSEEALEAAEKRPNRLSEEQVEELERQIYESMKSMVAKMLGRQAEESENSMTSIAQLAEQLGLGTTPETAAEAISEDGMWGVDAVSSRLMNMAMALSGGDVSKAEELRAAVQKGFEEVEELWGGELPQVSQDTYTETMNRFDYWVENGSLDGYGEVSAVEQHVQ